MIKNVNQVVLGTVQFGLDYGVSNKEGKTHNNEVKKILARGYQLGIRELDTAPSYGDAESIVMKEMQDDYKVNTKLLPSRSDDNKEALKTLEASVDMFGNNLNSIAIHRIEDLHNRDLISEIESLRESEEYIKIGVSIYNLDDLDIIKKTLKPDFIQLPFNIYDQRFKGNDLLQSFRFYGCEVHVRSVFLQGLLLMDTLDIPKGLQSLIPVQKKLIAQSVSENISIYKMCLSWVMKQNWVDKIVVGINDAMQLEILVKTINEIINEIDSVPDYSKFRVDDPLIVNPVNWS